MELDMANLLQIFSFESRVIKKLIDETIADSTYEPKCPLFYKMQ